MSSHGTCHPQCDELLMESHASGKTGGHSPNTVSTAWVETLALVQQSRWSVPLDGALNRNHTSGPGGPHATGPSCRGQSTMFAVKRLGAVTTVAPEQNALAGGVTGAQLID